MSILCIYCCGGMGREIADLSSRINKWDKIIFIDDNPPSRLVNNIEIFTLQEVLSQFEHSQLEIIVAAGEPYLRELLYTRVEEVGLNCVSIISPEFTLSRFSTLKEGTIIHTGAIATCNVQIGKGCLINKHAVIGHDVIIGDYCVISPNVTIGGNVTIAKNCYLGSGAIIRNGITIGENSIIGMGAVVLNDVVKNSVMVGNPAKFLRNNLDNIVFKR